MKSDLEMWLQKVDERPLREEDIRKVYVALDFGYGSGDCMIPLAHSKIAD